MPRKAQPTSHGLTMTARNKTNGAAVTPLQIVQSLTRNGDFFVFPLSKVKSVRRYADWEGLTVKISKRGDKAMVERIKSIFDAQLNKLGRETPVQAFIDYEDKITLLRKQIKSRNIIIHNLIGLMLEWMNKFARHDGELTARAEMMINDIESGS